MVELRVEDLSVTALGIEAVGAYILATGLLADARSIARRSGTYYGFNAADAVSQARDRVAAETGLAYLGVGFLLQIAAYGVVLGRDTPRVEGSLGAAATAIVLALIFAGAALLAYRWTHALRVKKRLVDVARWQGEDRLEKPEADRLRAFGKVLGEAAREGETAAQYLERVFGVVEFHPGSLTHANDLLPGEVQPTSEEFVTDALSKKMRDQGITG